MTNDYSSLMVESISEGKKILYFACKKTQMPR